MNSENSRKKDFNELIEELKSESVDTRLDAVRALRKIGDKKATKHLINALKKERNETTISNIFHTLRDIKGEEVQKFFYDYLEERKEQKLERRLSRFYDIVIKALVELNDPDTDDFLYKNISYEDSQGKGAFAEAFVKRMIEEGEKALLQTLDHKYYEVRWRAVDALGEILTGNAKEKILTTLSKKDEKFHLFFSNKIKALLQETSINKKILEEKKKTQLLDSFIYIDKFWFAKMKELLSEVFSDSWISQNIENPEIEKSLIYSLDTELRQGIKDSIKRILWNFGSDKAKTIFVDTELEEKISEYIKNNNAKGIVDIVRNFWNFEGEKVSHENIVKFAINGLEEIGNKEAIEFLFNFIRYSRGANIETEVLLALYALERLNPPDLMNELKIFLKEKQLNYLATAIAVVIGRRDIEYLIDVYESETASDESNHCSIAEAFGILQDSKTIDPLLNSLTRLEVDFETTVIHSLSRFDDSQITKKLIEKRVYYKKLHNEFFIALKWLFDNSGIKVNLNQIKSSVQKVSTVMHADNFIDKFRKKMEFNGSSEFEKYIEAKQDILAKIEKSKQHMDFYEQLRIVFKYIPSSIRLSQERDLYLRLYSIQEELFDITETHVSKDVEVIFRELFNLCLENKEIFAYFMKLYRTFGFVLYNIDKALRDTKPHSHSLLSFLKEGDENERKKALEWISMKGTEKEVIPYIRDILKNQDESPSIRKSAISALRRIDKEFSISSLLKLLEDKDFLVQKEALRILLELGEEDDEVTELLVSLGENIFPLINANLEKFDPWTVRISMYILQKIGEQNLSLLIANLEHEEKWIRLTTADVLRKIKDTSTVKDLLRSLKNEKDDDVCKYIVLALGETRDKQALNPLLELLERPKVEFKACIATALGKIGSKNAVDPLISCLKDENEHLRRCSAFALGMIGDKKALLNLKIMSEVDVSKDARKAAKDALDKIMKGEQ